MIIARGETAASSQIYQQLCCQGEYSFLRTASLIEKHYQEGGSSHFTLGIVRASLFFLLHYVRTIVIRKKAMMIGLLSPLHRMIGFRWTCMTAGRL
jgi:hypothetical protein